MTQHKLTSTRSQRLRSGMTLIELMIVLLILVFVAGIAAQSSENFFLTDVSPKATNASLVEIRSAVLQYWSDCKYEIGDKRIYLGDLFENPFDTAFDPTTNLGWRGPYLTNGTRVTDEILSQFPAFALQFIPNAVNQGYTRRWSGAASSNLRDPFYDIAIRDAQGLPFVIQDVTYARQQIGREGKNRQGLREIRIVSAGTFTEATSHLAEIDVSPTAFEDPLDAADEVFNPGDDQYVTLQLR